MWHVWWRNSYQVLVGKTDHLEDAGLVCGDDIKIDPAEMVQEGMD
jgi:hypothetical protein